jgi:predicted RND superfamily exporter protein
MVFSLTFIPASLVLLGRPKKILAARVAEGGVLNRMSERIGGFSLRHAGRVIVLFVVLLAAASAVSSQLRVRNNPVHYFRESSEIRTSDDFLNRHFPGTGEIHIQVDGRESGSLKDPDLLDRIRRLQDRAESLEEVGNTRSIADFLSRMNLVLHGEDPAFLRVPGREGDPEEGRNLVAQYLLLYEIAGGEELWKTVDDDYRRANIEVNVRSNSSEVYQHVTDRIREAGRETVGDRGDVAMTGSGIINLKVVRYLVLGQVYSLALSFVVVFLILLVWFRSLALALIGVIPLLITVAFNFAVMVLTGIPLTMGTALIASVCIGIGVDYSIHFINRYGLERERTPDLASTVQVTMHTSGRAILLNAISVGGGFAVLMFSSFLPIVYLGFLMPLIMAGNAFAALLVIPAFLNVKEGRARGKVSPIT